MKNGKYQTIDDDYPIKDENYQISLPDLLNKDLSSYEYFASLSDDIKRELETMDIRSFSELQSAAEELKKS